MYGFTHIEPARDIYKSILNLSSSRTIFVVKHEEHGDDDDNFFLSNW